MGKTERVSSLLRKKNARKAVEENENIDVVDIKTLF